MLTRKRFEQEIQRRVNATIRYKVLEAMVEECLEENRMLKRRIRKLEKEQEKKGTIHGFYASPAETTIIRKEEEK